MTTEAKPVRKPLDPTKLRPIEIHSSVGIHVGAKVLNTIRCGASKRDGIIRASEQTAEEMVVYPGAGVVVRIGERVTLVPFAVCDRIEMGE